MITTKMGIDRSEFEVREINIEQLTGKLAKDKTNTGFIIHLNNYQTKLAQYASMQDKENETLINSALDIYMGTIGSKYTPDAVIMPLFRILPVKIRLSVANVFNTSKFGFTRFEDYRALLLVLAPTGHMEYTEPGTPASVTIFKDRDEAETFLEYLITFRIRTPGPCTNEQVKAEIADIEPTGLFNVKVQGDHGEIVELAYKNKESGIALTLGSDDLVEGNQLINEAALSSLNYATTIDNIKTSKGLAIPEGHDTLSITVHGGSTIIYTYDTRVAPISPKTDIKIGRKSEKLASTGNYLELFRKYPFDALKLNALLFQNVKGSMIRIEGTSVVNVTSI